MWWTSTIQPTSAALFTQVCLLCVPMATKAFSDQSLSLHLPLSSHLVLSLPLCEFECFATACRSEAHPACFVSCRSLFFFDVSFPDVSDYFLRGAGRCFFGPANSGLHRRSLTLNRSSVSCVLFCLSVGWFHSVSLSAFLSVSLCFHGDVPCVQISCVQYTTPPIIPLLCAGFSKIQTNRWCWIIHPSE